MCCELNFPGSQHIAGQLYPCPWKPQRDLSFSQLVHWARICVWSYPPRHGDNHIAVAWVPLWWAIMPSWALHREANSQKSPVSSSLTFHTTMMQIRLFSTQHGCTLSKHKLPARAQPALQYTSSDGPQKAKSWPDSISFWLLPHWEVFHSERQKEGTLLPHLPCELTRPSRPVGMTHKPNWC